MEEYLKIGDVAPGICLTVKTISHTLRIYEDKRTESYTKAAWLDASTACRSGWGRLKQHRAPGARGVGDQGVASAAFTTSRGAGGEK